ncbi:uncharacterized protein [Onthophagus taurus]|uniref:uncharacterized protein n=1 Tax=Onthophagus taurus TaxID=166361 RepID=UPI0039BE2BE4
MYIVTVLLFQQISAQPQNISTTLFPELQSNYIGNLLKTYEYFTFVFHTENESFFRVNSIYKIFELNVHQTMLVYNYDSDGKENIVRQFGERFLNLVVMNDIFKFERFSKEPGRMAVNDVVLLFLYEKNYNDDDVEKWVKMGDHKIIGNVLILDLRNYDLITLNSTLFYSIKGGGIRDVLETTNKSYVEVDKKLLLPKKFDNLQGHLLHVGFINYFPYIFCFEYEEADLSLGPDRVKVCKNAYGVEAVLLQVLSDRMNFTYKLVTYPGESHGFIFEKVVEKRVDFVVGGITRTYSRVLKATFTMSHISEGYTYLYIYKVGVFSYLFMFFFPFQWELWVFIIFVVIVIALLTFFLIGLKISFYNSLIGTLNALLEQVVTMKQNYFNNQQILSALHLTWWFVSICIATYYRAKLASLFIKPPHQEPTSVQRILDDGYEITVDGVLEDAIKEFYQHQSTDRTMRKAAENTVYIKGLCPVLNYTLTHKAALFDEFGYTKYHSQIECPDLIGPHKKLNYEFANLRTVGKPLIVIPHGWPLPKGTPFTFPINMYKLRLRDGK